MRIIDLGGKWSVNQAGKRKSYPATVPGNIQLDLLAAGAIGDPFYRDNEKKQMWIGDSDWIYERSFSLDKDALAHDRLLLHCDGLDTLATVVLNGRTVAKTDNMFRVYEWDVKRFLKAGKNTLTIRFASATRHGMKQQKKRRVQQGGVGSHRLDGGNRIRKEQCNFGWDWGPMCVTCGVWRPIRLVAFDEARLADVHVTQDHKRNAVDLTVRIGTERVARGALSASVTVTHKGRTVTATRIPVRGEGGRARLTVKNPKLWWPFGMGKQPLYEVAVDLMDADGNLLDTVTKRIGLRTLRLVQKKDKWGRSFHFEANGVPFFAKGANWIPADQFQTRVSAEQYEDLLQSAVEANMNMLRVWGGGIYEEDIFYDLCDELGICIWQDFMFACASYPAFDPDFMENVRLEAVDNVRRMRHHPSLALWCGNNELEQMRIATDVRRNDRMTWAEYKDLFDKLLPKVVKQCDPERDYWPSSPHSPVGDRNDHNNDKWGDAHLWSVWHGQKPFEWYRTAFHRFCSEFGFQSFPEPKTVRGYTNEEERNPTSYVMELHQRSGVGNSRIMDYMLSWYRLPVGFENVLWMSQIQQGLAIKYAVEHWRRNMPRCMGALYWQINDTWPVASWASIDYHGRWKALHFMARRFFEPMLISGVEDNAKGTVEIHVSSDLMSAKSGTASWTLTNTNGKALASGRKRIRIGAGKSAKVDTLRLKPFLESHTERDLMVWLELTVGGKVVSTNFVTFARPKHFALPDPDIRAKVKTIKGGAFAVTLKARRPALWAFMELKKADACFNDNFICLEPGKATEIIVTPEKPMTKSQFMRQLQVKSLVDTYSE